MKHAAKSILLAGAVALAQAGAAIAADLKPVTFAVATADLNVGYPFATLPAALGYFEDEGLDVSVVPGQSSAATVQLLLTGRANVGVAQPDPVMIQRAKAGIPLVSVYPVSRRGTNRFIVLPDSDIQSVEDLKGKTVGVGDLGSGSVNYLKAKLTEVGLSMDDVQLLATGYGTPGHEALKNGVTDAAISFTGGIARMKVAGYDVRMLPAPEAESNQYSYNLFATEEYIAENPDVIKGIGRAMARATVYLKNNPEAAVKIFWDQYPDRAPKDRSDAAAMERDLMILQAQVRDMAADEMPDDFAWGSQDPEVYSRMQDYLVTAGQIESPIDVSRYYDDSFAEAYTDFDPAPIAEAAKAYGTN